MSVMVEDLRRTAGFAPIQYNTIQYTGFIQAFGDKIQEVFKEFQDTIFTLSKDLSPHTLQTE